MENAKPSHPIKTEEKRGDGSICGKTPDHALDAPACTPPHTQRSRREGRASMCCKGLRKEHIADLGAEWGSGVFGAKGKEMPGACSDDMNGSSYFDS